MTWEFSYVSSKNSSKNHKLVSKKHPIKLNNPILIEGLPGIGNVGKIAADFMIENTKAKKIYDVFSYKLPNSVFVNEENLVELPSIELFLKKSKKNDILILTGDVQPVQEEATYEFCDALIELAKSLGVKQVITLAGIGLAEEPTKPKVFCTATSKKIIDEFTKQTTINKELFTVVGPIIGVSGVLVGMCGKKNIDAVCLLAQTLGHPTYIGVLGAKELLMILDKKFHLGLNMKDLDKEIAELEAEGMLLQTKSKKGSSLKKVHSLSQSHSKKETSYIG